MQRCETLVPGPLYCRIVLTLLACLLITGCTNSKLIIGPLYNQLDNQIRSEFDKLGDFTAAQTEAFEASVGTFHTWHRQSELPKYAQLLKDIAASISEAGNTRPEDVKGWMDTAEVYSQAARHCYPANFSGKLIQSLSDEQITFIERRFYSERRKNREKRGSQTAKDRVERRLKNLDKWTGRMDLPLTANQRATLRTSLTRQTSLRKQYNALSARWMRELFKLARNKGTENHPAALNAHIGSLWNLLEINHPDEWRANRDLWQKTIFSIEQSMSPDQRASSSRWMNTMAETLLAVSADKPGYTPGKDPSIGCLVDTSS